MEYSVVRCVVLSLPLCFHCRYHDTVNEEERCTFNLFHVLTTVPSLPSTSSTPVFNYSSITDKLSFYNLIIIIQKGMHALVQGTMHVD